ncbi:glucose PTS transporter subunit IIA [Latilactobacillus sakei]|uniref:glucose PTS transporter subunit IIA n=1 Tax=Latilactobacillus sakei TaxID=1599 RepID=UPI000B961B2C|nr:glucose PTS transporter subunit IIA [Latilactobacillus sakei]AST84562.1 PTS beta-glucoside transporter subunit EIIBCA [Latilactobacillus sakei]
MTQSYKEISKNIIEGVGGEENIKSLTHCVTRLRFVLKDTAKVKQDMLEQMPIVMTALSTGGQYQVVIGPKVTDVYDAVMVELGNLEDNTNEPEEKKKLSDRLLATISAIFTPYINILAAAGVLKGLVILIQMMHLFGEKSLVLAVLNALASGVFTMLPIFIAITGAEKFKSNKYTAVALAAALIYPLTAADIPANVMLGSLAIPLKVYGGAVLPTIFAVYFLSIIEKWLKNIIPEVAKLVFVPTLALLITGFVTFLVIGPLANYVGVGIANVYTWLYNLSPVISGAILAGVGQFFVIFGIHWGIIPLGQINVQVLGYDTIMAMFMSAVFGQFGAVVGSIFTSRNSDERQISISASISALFGITEPALYGVNVKKKYPFVAGCIGAAVGGGITGLLGVKLYGFAPVLNIFMLGMFNGPQSKMIYEVVAVTAAFLIAAILTIIWGRRYAKHSQHSDVYVSTEVNNDTKLELHAPVTGEAIAITEVSDPVFASKMMGDGFAVKPDNGQIYAPIEGVITSVFPTKHAITLKGNNCVDVLLHMGIDTVALKGQGFDILVTENQKVTTDTQLANIDLTFLASEGKDDSIMVIFPENLNGEVNVKKGHYTVTDMVGEFNKGES